jgi:hypothetical protein
MPAKPNLGHIDFNQLDAAAGHNDEVFAGLVEGKLAEGYTIHHLHPAVRRRLLHGGMSEELLARYVPSTSSVRPNSASVPVVPTPPPSTDFALDFSPPGQVPDARKIDHTIASKISGPHLIWRDTPPPNYSIIPNYAFNPYNSRHFIFDYPRDELTRRIAGLKDHGCAPHEYSELTLANLQRQFSTWQFEIHDRMLGALRDKAVDPKIVMHSGYYDWRRLNDKAGEVTEWIDLLSREGRL